MTRTAPCLIHRPLGGLLLLIWIAAVSASGASSPLDRWHWRSPAPQGNDLRAAAYGPGVWVVVGTQGTVLRSTDAGVTWQTQQLGRFDFNRVAFGNGTFVVIGQSDDGLARPLLFVSSDGESWVDRSTEIPTGQTPIDIAFGNGAFLVVDGNREVGRSTNGLNWTWHYTGDAAPSRLAFGGDRFVGFDDLTIGTETGLVSRVAVSMDGMNWTERWVGAPGWWTDLAYGAGRFMLAGARALPSGDYEIFTMSSFNGLDWTTNYTSQTNWPGVIQYGSGRWLLARENPAASVLTSPDAISWTEQPLPLTNAWSFVAQGSGQFILGGSRGNFLRSASGSTWIPCSGGGLVSLHCVARGDGMSIAVGDGGLLLASADNRRWDRIAVPTTQNLRSIAWARDRCVTVGSAGTILITALGTVWKPVPAPTTGGYNGVAFSGAVFVAVGENGIISYSGDGLSWTNAAPVTTRELKAVTWTGHRFVAVGQNGTFLTSVSGANWATGFATDGRRPFLQGVAGSSNLLVAVGQEGAVYLSATGQAWQRSPASAEMFQGLNLSDVALAAGSFVLVGERGLIATSADGLTWTNRFSRCGNTLHGVRYCDSRLLAAGENETVIQSDFVGSPVMNAGAMIPGVGYLFSIEAETGQSGRIQTTVNFEAWTDGAGFTGIGEPQFFLQDEAELQPRCFFRVVCP